MRDKKVYKMKNTWYISGVLVHISFCLIIFSLRETKMKAKQKKIETSKKKSYNHSQDIDYVL